MARYASLLDMGKMYDVFFFLVMSYFPEIKEELKKNPDFTKYIKMHHLVLLSKTLNVDLGTSKN